MAHKWLAARHFLLHGLQTKVTSLVPLGGAGFPGFRPVFAMM
jgi:hypothetical protein